MAQYLVDLVGLHFQTIVVYTGRSFYLVLHACSKNVLFYNLLCSV